MAWSTPRTWVTGELVTAAIMNQYVRDQQDWLVGGHGCKVYRSTNQSIPHSATATAISFTAEHADTDGYHSNVTDPSRATIPAGLAGYYSVASAVRWTGNAAGRREIGHYVNESHDDTQHAQMEDAPGATSIIRYGTTTTFLFLGVGDYVETRVVQTTGSALNAEAAWMGLALHGT